MGVDMAEVNGIKSQNESILRYLRSGGKVTSLTALQMFGCLRLSGRVWDLKKEGHNIKNRWVRVGRGSRMVTVKEYFLVL
jgi:hypothetical protein